MVWVRAGLPPSGGQGAHGGTWGHMVLLQSFVLVSFNSTCPDLQVKCKLYIGFSRYLPVCVSSSLYYIQISISFLDLFGDFAVNYLNLNLCSTSLF